MTSKAGADLRGEPTTPPAYRGSVPTHIRTSGRPAGEKESNMAKKEVETSYIYKPDEDKLVITGALTAYRHGTNKYDRDTEKYYVSVRTAALPPEVILDIKERYFSETKEKYLPEILKDTDQGKEEIYFNLKSLYEIPAFVAGKGNTRYSYDDVIELGDGLPPHGSTVKLSIRLKEGAMYPLAIQFIEIVKTSADDYFA